MVARAPQCDQERLKQLLDGKLSDVDQCEVADHLQACSSCRSKLESIAADDVIWRETRAALSDIDDGQIAWDPTDEPASVPLSFLAPSDNPAMLGRIGEFEILELIGCGGMGIVLKGYDHELNRFVAVKVLHPHCATSASARRRFAREAQAAAAVVHQHVVAIHAVDGNHHPPYLVMPFIPGESLQQRLTRQGPLDVVEVLRIGQQVAEGLAAAHAQGLVHRDIKPGNILLERNVDRVLLTDFGLARAADDASLTQSGVIAGTPQFMSPEQTRGDSIDHRTDLFSLGTVLYTLLAGHSPFRAETAMGVLRRVCEETPRPLREINPAVPAWFEAFIARLHARQPADRFESAAQVADLLTRCLAHVQQPTVSPLPREVTALRQRSRKTGFPFWRVGAVAIIASALLIPIVRGRIVHPSLPRDQKEAKIQIDDDWDGGHAREVRGIQSKIERLEREPEHQF